MDIFKELLNVMEEINDIYIKLYKLELTGELNTSYFFELVSELKKLLVKEEDLFNQLVKSSDYEYIKEHIINEKGPTFSRINDYIKLYESVNMEVDNSEQKELTNKLRRIYGACSKNVFLVYLSIYQDYIDNILDLEIKERLLSLKYYNAFTKLIIGQLLIENDFKVARENYVDLYLVADMVNIEDMDSYDIILDGNKDVIMGMLEQLFKVTDKAYNDYNVIAASKGIEFMIRACFAILSESEYETIKDDVFNKIYELSNDENNRALEIVDEILEGRIKDKVRVRKISLRPIED